MSYYVLAFQYGHVEEMAGLEGVEGCMEPLAVLSSASLGSLSAKQPARKAMNVSGETLLILSYFSSLTRLQLQTVHL